MNSYFAKRNIHQFKLFAIEDAKIGTIYKSIDAFQHNTININHINSTIDMLSQMHSLYSMMVNFFSQIANFNILVTFTSL